MKTKIRTFIGLVALGMIGFTNINATAGNKEVNAYFTVEEEKDLDIEAWMLDNDLWIEKTEANTEKAVIEKELEIESWMTDEKNFKAVDSFTVKGAGEKNEKFVTN